MIHIGQKITITLLKNKHFSYRYINSEDLSQINEKLE